MTKLEVGQRFLFEAFGNSSPIEVIEDCNEKDYYGNDKYKVTFLDKETVPPYFYVAIDPNKPLFGEMSFIKPLKES